MIQTSTDLTSLQVDRVCYIMFKQCERILIVFISCFRYRNFPASWNSRIAEPGSLSIHTLHPWVDPHPITRILSSSFRISSARYFTLSIQCSQYDKNGPTCQEEFMVSRTPNGRKRFARYIITAFLMYPFPEAIQLDLTVLLQLINLGKVDVSFAYS